MKKRKTLTALILALAMTAGLAGCGGGSSTSDTQSGSESAQETEAGSDTSEESAGGEETAAEATSTTKDTLVVALDSDPGTMNPWSGPMGPQLSLSCQSVEALTTYDEDGELIPWLAESWEFDDENMGCTFYLRQDVTFSNGDPFNAEAVRFTMQEATTESASAKGYLANVDVDNIEVIDDYTIHIPTKVAFGTLPYTMSNIFIVDPNTYAEEAAAGEGITGTGPFVCTDWEAGVKVTFTANETYWRGAPLIKTLEMRFITESSVRMIELENGTVDIYKNATSEDLNRVLNGEVENATAWQADISQAFFFLGVNMKSEAMQNEKVRQALMMAIDTDTLALLALDQTGIPATTILPSNMWYTATLNNPYTYDPEGAKALLEEAGVENLTVRLKVDSNAVRQAVAEALPSMLEKAGIEIEVSSMESAAYNTWKLETDGSDYDIFLLNAGQLNEPSSALSGYSASVNVQGGGGLFLYSDTEIGKEIDDLLNAAYAESDQDARAQIYFDFQNTVNDNYIAKGIVGKIDTNLIASNLKGMVFRPNIDLSKAYFE